MAKLISGMRWYFLSKSSSVKLPRVAVESIIRKYGADEWHIWAICNYGDHREAALGMQWILKNVDPKKHIFETGCGCGANLIWLGQRGFKNLSGADLSEPAISAGRELAKYAGLRIDLWQDNSLAPKRVPDWDALLAIDWTYLSNVDCDISSFLGQHQRLMRPRAVVLIDVVDASFNDVPDNEYRTDDWLLPPAQRRPTQYKLRMTTGQVRQVADELDFDVIDLLPGSEVPPRTVYVLKARAG